MSSKTLRTSLDGGFCSGTHVREIQIYVFRRRIIFGFISLVIRCSVKRSAYNVSCYPFRKAIVRSEFPDSGNLLTELRWIHESFSSGD